MIPSGTNLGLDDRRAFWTAVDFLKHRLTEPNTIEWALHLTPDQRIERMAICHLLNSTTGSVLEELQEYPWADAWRLIQESWSQDFIEELYLAHVFDIGLRLHAGDRSGSIVTAIVNLVAPRLKVEPIDSFTWDFIKKPRRPKTIEHLLSVSLTSGDLLDLNDLRLPELTDLSFLMALAKALEGTVNRGLDAARRIGWNGTSDLWQLGSMHRVRYARYPDEDGEQREPDAHHHGIAPAVKLLHAVVTRLGELDPASARPFVQRWRLDGSPIHIRLWSELSLNRQFISVQEVEEFLLGLDQPQFWELHEFPEIAELRALRFGELGYQARRMIVRRIRKRPPYNYWPREVGAEAIEDARMYWAVREVKRIEVAGGELPPDVSSWLQTMVSRFPDLAEMTIDHGFPAAPRAHAVPPSPDDRYDTLRGVVRLRSLEAALSSGRGGRSDSPAMRAGDWMGRLENTLLVLYDLESAEDGGDEFPHVWNRFGWMHIPEQLEAEGKPERDQRDEGERVLRLVEKLSERTLSAAVASVSNWLRVWSKHFTTSGLGSWIWLRVWPIAVKATNDLPQPEEAAQLSVLAATKIDRPKIRDLDTLNNPTGKMVSAFLSFCPLLVEVPSPFCDGSSLREMRSAVINCTGRSALISRYRLLESLRYFLQADCDWTQRHLIAPLRMDDDTSLVLWRAAATGPLFTGTLAIIGDEMAERAVDFRLGRETRKRLAFSLVVESLHAFRKCREPVVSNPRVQQMLRSLDDGVRADAAETIRTFVHEISTNEVDTDLPSVSAGTFRSAAAPFLAQVWPLEISLSTPGVSRALARLPATSGDAFAEAVNAIERFLVPFQCWSMLEYGLYGDDGGIKKLSFINDERKAEAFLRLLDLTVGTSDVATIPHDLTDALDQIRRVSPTLVSSPRFRRLVTAARR